MDPTITDPRQTGAGTNIFSRQYIEEWFRYSARNVLKFNYGGADQQTAGTGLDSKTTNPEGASQTYGDSQQPQQVYSSVSVAGGSTAEQV